jgi:segregation and condensation protein B
MFKHGPMEIEQLKRIVEAAIMAASTPQTLVQLNDLFGEENPPGVDSIHAAIELLQSDYAERGVALVEVASGWRFQVRPDVQAWVSRLWTERQAKYTRALLETLALIAYRQPVTRAEIEQIRGVAVSSNIIKTLEEREWIRVVGHRDVPGKPALFGTTRQFLDYFALKSLDQLPPLAELRDITEIEPQLAFDGIAPVTVAAENGDTGEAAVEGTDGSEDAAMVGVADDAVAEIEAPDVELEAADDVDSETLLEDDAPIDLVDDAIIDVETDADPAATNHESIEADVTPGTAPASAKDTP